MTTPDEHGRIDPPSAGDEVATLLGFLDYQRATFGWKTAGLGADELNVTIAASDMTLGGMMRHLALVEDSWLSERLMGKDPASPWQNVDWESDRDWEWHSAVRESPASLRALWEESVERSRASVAEFLRDGDLGDVARRHNGRAPSARWILCHMIEEYARHNGHADLLREVIDGETGE